MSETDHLVVPEAAKSDCESFELLRIWIAKNSQHVSLRIGVWNDPAAWGIMLSDLAKHIAHSYEKDCALDRVQTLQRIKAAFDVEMDSPTDTPSGQ